MVPSVPLFVLWCVQMCLVKLLNVWKTLEESMKEVLCIRNTFHGSGRKLARVTLQMQNLSFASWIRKPAVVLRVNPENTADRIPRCAHSVVNLGTDTCIVYGGFGGTSWRTDGWGIARRAKVFAFAVKTCSSRVPSSPKQGKQLDIKTKVPVETGDIPCPRYGHTMVNLGENRCGGKALCLEDFGKLISIHHLEMYTP